MANPDGSPTTKEFVIGFFVSVTASIFYAAGLNLLKKDHVKNSSLPKDKQRVDCCRPLWHIGLYLYIFSQGIGSTIALNYLKAQWVAPLGSVSLIFNFIFARLFVGTKITRQDILGTFIVLVSVCWIVFFGGQNNNYEEPSLSLSSLKSLISQLLFIIYFSILNFVTIILLIVGLYINLFVLNEKRELVGLFKNIERTNLRKFCGMIMATVAGLFASQTLLLAKSGVRLFFISVETQVSQFTDLTGWFILTFLLITAVLQIVFLNVALKLCDSVLVVPIFLGLYTTMGLINTIIYLNEVTSYPAWALIAVFLGIIALIYGVLLLSHIKNDTPPSDNEDDSNNVDDYDDETLSGLSSWSDDSFFDKKKSNKRWMGGGIKGLFKRNKVGISNPRKDKIPRGRGGRFRKLELNDHEEKSKNLFIGFKGFKGFKGFYHNGSAKSDGYNSEYNSCYSSENNSKFSIGVNSDNNSDLDLNSYCNPNPIAVKEWSGDLGSIINLDKLITESVIGKRIITENMEKESGFAV